MTTDDERMAAIQSFYGNEPRVSDWLRVEQKWIDQFGESTLDTDWLHTDPERARNESPFGGTIAFGFWTISMLTYFTRQMLGRDYPPRRLIRAELRLRSDQAHRCCPGGSTHSKPLPAAGRRTTGQ